MKIKSLLFLGMSLTAVPGMVFAQAELPLVDAETGVARPQPGQPVEVYDALKAGAYRYEEAQGLKNDTFHLIVVGFREP